MELSYGTNLISKDEKLSSITLTDLCTMIQEKDSPLANQQAVLRSIISIDEQKYRNIKKRLPYFVCGKFATGRRKIDEFASTSSFVLDLDHYDSPDKSLEEIKDELAADPRIALIYTSPSGKGLKLLFTLDKPCTDANVYSSFYRQFAMAFAQEYNIIGYVDYKTNDVTRACFLAHDPDCRINLDAEGVSMDSYVSLDNVDFFLRDDKMLDRAFDDLPYVDYSVEMPKSIDPNEETLKHIKEILDTNRRKHTQKVDNTLLLVPEEIMSVMDGLKNLMDEAGVELYDTRGIQYGIKLMLRTSLLWAEINVFYGQRGYSVVLSPKRGSSQELGCLMQELISDYFSNLAA